MTTVAEQLLEVLTAADKTLADVRTYAADAHAQADKWQQKAATLGDQVTTLTRTVADRDASIVALQATIAELNTTIATLTPAPELLDASLFTGQRLGAGAVPALKG